MVQLQINGQTLQAGEGETLLTAARREGIEIPTLCHHEAIEPWGGCRVCLVQITHRDWKGWKGLVTSCIYQVEEGLEVFTDNEAVRGARRVVLDLLLARCPGAPAIQKLAARYGVHETSYRKNPIKNDCILCTQCVRVCAAKGPNAISTGDRGAQKKIAIPFRKPPPDCIGCLSCAHICPTGVIKYEDKGPTRKIWGRTFYMVRCEGCGKRFMTEEQLAFEKAKAALPDENFTCCPECKKKKVVERIGTTFTP
jgi:NADH dehydrogenase/NADH:ubiquinone oxidoreductase subunit G